MAEGTLGESQGCSSLSQGGERGLVSHPRGFVSVWVTARKVGESQSSPLPQGVQSQEGGTEVGGDTEHPEAVAVGGRSRPLSGRVGPGVWGAGGAACGWPGGEPPLRSAPTHWAGSFGTEPRGCPEKEVWALF